MSDMLPVGAIVGAYGVKGWIKVKPFAKPPLALLGNNLWWFQPNADLGQVVLEPSAKRVLHCKRYQDMLVAEIDQLVDRTAAQALRGTTLLLARNQFPATNANEFYWVDLIGCQVSNPNLNTHLGTVTDLIETGQQAVLCVSGNDREYLIPFVDAHVGSVDLQAKQIETLWDPNWSKQELSG